MNYNNDKKMQFTELSGTFVAFLLMLVGEIKAVGNGDQWKCAIDTIGIIIFPLLLSKIVYLKNEKHIRIISLGMFFFAFVCVLGCIKCAKYPLYRTFLIVTEIIIFVSIWVYYIIFLVRHHEVLNVIKSVNKFFFMPWLIMMLMSVLSINEAVWPLYFTAVFGLLSIIKINRTEISFFVKGTCLGVILSFFVLQGYALLRRPYEDVRYLGITDNSNETGMFYTVALLATLALLLYCINQRVKRAIVALTVLASIVMSFTYLTVSRTALMAMSVCILLFLFVDAMQGKLYFKSIRHTFVMLLLSVLFLFPVYLSVRYIPAIMHHPKYFPYQGNSESMVNKYDPIDSDKYVAFAELLECYGARATQTIGKVELEDEPIELNMTDELKGANVPKMTDNTDVAGVVFAKDGCIVKKYPDGVEPGADSEHPYVLNERHDGLLAFLGTRKYLYLYAISRIRVFGNVDEYPFGWLTSNFPAYHSHNSFLQMFLCFGIIPGFLFLTLILSSIIYLLNKIRKREYEWYFSFILLSVVAFLMWSLTECVAFPGNSMFSILFLCFSFLSKKDSING